jgi:anti-anti-sigma factor
MLDFYFEDRGENDEILLIVLSGNLDTIQANYLDTVIQKQIQRGQKKVILDCDGLDYISSMGLALMLRLNSKMKKLGGEVRLSGVKGIVSDAIRLVKLDTILGVYDSVDDAVKAADVG